MNEPTELRDHAYAPIAHAYASRSVQHVYAGRTLLRSYASTAPPHVYATPPGQANEDRSEPLRVVHLTAAAVSGGIDTWMRAFTQFADPSRLIVDCCLVLHPHMIGPRQQRSPVHRMVGGVSRETLVQCCHDADALLISDPGPRAAEVASWIAEAKVPRVVFVAHGEAAYTRQRLNQVRSVCDHVVCVSEWVRDRLRPTLPHSVIRNGIDARRSVATIPARQRRTELGFHRKDQVLGFVGRFSEEKNPVALLKSLARLPKHFKVLMIGYGPLEQSLLAMANGELAGRVKIVDGQAVDQMGDFYQVMNYLVVPSTEEGYGLVTMEAMMAGTPVLATRRGVAADLIRDGKNGILLTDDAGEPLCDQLVHHVRALEANVTQTRRIAEAARRTANRFGHASTMMRQYERLLREGLSLT